ncbi:glutamine synthetase/guanido kinase [Coniochaeta sp. PMI_546]|nr:glutamine synthetase/guanido kinase [Coniochaeta sp. PMI_546]
MSSATEKTMAPFPKFLTAHPKVEYIEFLWVDFFGITRVRKHSLSRAREMAEGGLPLMLPTVFMASHLEDVSSIPNFSITGAASMQPDWTSVRLLGDERHAAVSCWFVGNTALGCDSPPEGSGNRCPRTALQQVLELCRGATGAEFLVGFELEFYLLDEPFEPKPLNPFTSTNAETAEDPRVYWSTASAMRSSYGDCVEACVEALEMCGISVHQFHAEGSFQQFEITLGPRPPLQATDSLVVAVEIIKRVASRRGLSATFFPKPFAKRCSSGLHAHISMSGVSPEANSFFLAGMLKRLTLLAAFGMPNAVSYERLGFPMLCEWVSWGQENKDTGIRRVKPNHWELRAMDFTANPYLVLSTYIAAGLLGITGEEALTWKDCEIPCSQMSDAQRRDHGVTVRLPRSLQESNDIMREGFQGLEEVLGPAILEHYRYLRDQDKRQQDQKNPNDILHFLAKEF